MPDVPFFERQQLAAPEIRGVIFDKDGTLFDFRATWGFVFKLAIKLLSNGEITLQQKLAFAAGFNLTTGDFLPNSLSVHGTTVEIAKVWLPLIEWEKGLDHLVEFLNAEFAIYVTEHCLPMTDLTELLTDMKCNRKLAIGMVTCDSTQSAFDNLDKYNARHYFDFIAGYDSPFGSKPDPSVVYAFCKQTGLTPQEVIIVGDSARDMNTGKNANLALSVGVRTKGYSDEMLGPNADIIIDSVAQLGALLDTLPNANHVSD